MFGFRGPNKLSITHVCRIKYVEAIYIPRNYFAIDGKFSSIARKCILIKQSNLSAEFRK